MKYLSQSSHLYLSVTSRETLLEEEATIIGDFSGDFLGELASDKFLSSSLFINIEPLVGLKSENLLGTLTSLLEDLTDAESGIKADSSKSILAVIEGRLKLMRLVSRRLPVLAT